MSETRAIHPDDTPVTAYPYPPAPGPGEERRPRRIRERGRWGRLAKGVAEVVGHHTAEVEAVELVDDTAFTEVADATAGEATVSEAIQLPDSTPDIRDRARRPGESAEQWVHRRGRPPVPSGSLLLDDGF